MYSCLEGIRGRHVAPRLCLCGVALAALVGAAGCASQQQPQATPPPMVIDEAMQRRDWEPSVAFIPSGNVVAGVNRFPLRSPGNYTAAGTPDYTGAALDYAASLGQTIALPFTYLFVPPFEPQEYAAEELGPTYTGMTDMRPAGRGPARVDGVMVDPDTLEVIPEPDTQRQAEEQRRRGPLGPGDTEFMSSPPSPARQ